MKSLMSVRVFLCGLVAGCCLTGCRVERPETVFSDEQMTDVLYDYHLAKAMADELPYSESYKRVPYMESVYRKHNITREQFDSSMVWFTRHPDVLAKIYDGVKERLTVERDGINHLIAIRDNKPKESLPGDSIDVWIWRRVHQLTGMPLDNKLTFSLPSDTNFKQRDTLVWTVRFNFAARDSLLAPTMAMQVLYANDTLCSAPKHVYASGVQSLSLAADTLGELKEVRGFVYYPMGETPGSLLLDSISLMRYHATDTLKHDTLKVINRSDETGSLLKTAL